MWRKKITAKAKKFTGVKIETKVLDNDSLEAVTQLAPGGAYGHSVEIGKLRAFWPVPLRIHCTLRDTRQLAFRQSGAGSEDSSSWDWETTLYPDRIGGEEKRLLICAQQKSRGEDRITVKITGDDREEDVPLKVSLE
jgi:hypothetical protein